MSPVPEDTTGSGMLRLKQTFEDGHFVAIPARAFEAVIQVVSVSRLCFRWLLQGLGGGLHESESGEWESGNGRGGCAERVPKPSVAADSKVDVHILCIFGEPSRFETEERRI